jgi:hypothetical protein
VRKWRYSSTILQLGIRCEVSGQLHATADLLPGKQPSVRIGYEEWDPKPIWTLWSGEKSLALVGK